MTFQKDFKRKSEPSAPRVGASAARRVAGITTNPTGAWSTQAARNLFVRHGDRLDQTRALLRDRGSQFTDSFDEILRTEGLKILRTPIRTPVANTFADQAATTREPSLQVLRTTRCDGLINEYRKRRLTSHDAISGTHRGPKLGRGG